jgi:hypothetical protein
MQLLIKCIKWTNGLLGRCLRHSFGMPSNPQAFLNFKVFINFYRSHGHIISRGLLSTASSRAWTLASTRHSWFSSHKSCGENWFSKQSAIALVFSSIRNCRPEEPWLAVGAPGSLLLMRNFAMGHIPWGVMSQLAIFVSYCSSAFFWVIRLIDSVTQLTAVFHAGSLVSCHNFLSLCLCSNNRSRPGR